MAKEIEIQKHKLAYLAYKGGSRTEEIASRLGVANATIISWRSPSGVKCSCPWHNWGALTTIDTPVNHRRAFALASTGHSFEDIAAGLGIPIELVTEWSVKSFPCSCGCHDWAQKEVNDAPVADIIDIKSNNSLSPIPMPVNTSVEDAQTSTLHVTLNALSMAVQKEDVVPRSWKDVLDTLKTVSDIVKDLAPKTPILSPDNMARFSRTESFEIPQSNSDVLRDETTTLASQLKKVAIGSVSK